jgi:prophage DNA circulation protein
MTNIAKAIHRLREERRDAQNQVQKLGEAIAVLEKLSRGTGAAVHAVTAPRKRILSAAGRRRISLAQKARWAKIRQTKKAA